MIKSSNVKGKINLLDGHLIIIHYFCYRQLASLESEAVSAGVILPSSLDVDCNGE